MNVWEFLEFLEFQFFGNSNFLKIPNLAVTLGKVVTVLFQKPE